MLIRAYSETCLRNAINLTSACAPHKFLEGI